MSNPKPVEGARELPVKWRRAAKEKKPWWKSIFPFTDDEAYLLDKCADELEAALSAAPAPTEMNLCEISWLILHKDQAYIFRQAEGCPDCAAYLDPPSAPARDGVRAYEMATAAEVEVATICGHLESGKYRIEVVKALEKRFAAALAAPKEQADGQG